MVLNAPAVIRTLGSPGFIIDAVDRIDGALTGIDPLGPVVGHFEILKVKEPACLAGNEHNRLAAAAAIDLEFHIPVQVAAVVLEITNFHRFLLCICQKFVFYNPRQSINTGICFSQDASLWSPPGTTRNARFARLVNRSWDMVIMVSAVKW